MTFPATAAPNHATITLIVPAAGCGARAAQNGNKILAPLAGRPLLFHTLRHLLTDSPHTEYGRNRPYLAEVIIAARRDEWPAVQRVWNDVSATLDGETPDGETPDGETPDGKTPAFQLVEGGATRQDSVLSAVRAARGAFVAVHDAARPFASRALLEKVWRGAQNSGAAIAALPASDTVKCAAATQDLDAQDSDAFVANTIERTTIWLAQTPQVFRRALLEEALQAAQQAGWAGTDCASAVERLRDNAGNPRVRVALVQSDAANFKVTFAADLVRAEWLLQSLRKA